MSSKFFSNSQIEEFYKIISVDFKYDNISSALYNEFNFILKEEDFNNIVSSENMHEKLIYSLYYIFDIYMYSYNHGDLAFYEFFKDANNVKNIENATIILNDLFPNKSPELINMLNFLKEYLNMENRKLFLNLKEEMQKHPSYEDWWDEDFYIETIGIEYNRAWSKVYKAFFTNVQKMGKNYFKFKKNNNTSPTNSKPKANDTSTKIVGIRNLKKLFNSDIQIKNFTAYTKVSRGAKDQRGDYGELNSNMTYSMKDKKFFTPEETYQWYLDELETGALKNWIWELEFDNENFKKAQHILNSKKTKSYKFK